MFESNHPSSARNAYLQFSLPLFFSSLLLKFTFKDLNPIRDCGLAAIEARTFSFLVYHGFTIAMRIATNQHHRINTGHDGHIVATNRNKFIPIGWEVKRTPRHIHTTISWNRTCTIRRNNWHLDSNDSWLIMRIIIIIIIPVRNFDFQHLHVYAGKEGSSWAVVSSANNSEPVVQVTTGCCNSKRVWNTNISTDIFAIEHCHRWCCCFC